MKPSPKTSVGSSRTSSSGAYQRRLLLLEKKKRATRKKVERVDRIFLNPFFQKKYVKKASTQLSASPRVLHPLHPLHPPPAVPTRFSSAKDGGGMPRIPGMPILPGITVVSTNVNVVRDIYRDINRNLKFRK